MVKEIDLPIDPFTDSLNRGDGTRRWHRKFVAVEQPLGERPGVCFWIGEQREKNKVISCNVDKSFHPTHLTDPYYFFKRDGTGFLAEHSIFELMKGVLVGKDGVIAHKRGVCGDIWVGMAIYPLPQDHLRPDSFWNGWTHLFHWQAGDEDALELLPQKVLDFFWQRLKQDGYPTPQELRILTNELINKTDLGNHINYCYLGEHFHFPWRDKNLGSRM